MPDTFVIVGPAGCGLGRGGAHRLESVKLRPLGGGGAWLQVPDISNYMHRELGYVLFSYLFNLPHPPLPPPNSPLADSGHLLLCHRTAEQLLIKPANHNREGAGECEGWERARSRSAVTESSPTFISEAAPKDVCLYPHGAPPGGGGGEQLTERVGGRDRRAD